MSEQSESAGVRRTARFGGQVQGVGFRYTTNTLAARFPVTGFVRNLPDGSVELVAEGRAEAIEQFVAAIRDRMGGYIDAVDETDSPATGEFSSFGIGR